MVVAGQVKAQTTSYNGLQGKKIKEVDLAKAVMPIPEGLNGKLFGAGTDLSPVQEAGQIIKMTIQAGEGQKAFAMKKDRKIFDAAGQPLAGGVHVTAIYKLMGKNRLVLYDKDEKPICVAVQDNKEVLHKAYFVYGLEPIHPNDKAKEKEAGVHFYPWIRVSDTESEMQIPFRLVSSWNGQKYVPMLGIREATKGDVHGKKAGIETVLLDAPKAGDNVITDAKDSHKVYGLVLKKGAKKAQGWEVVVAPGVDPAMMIMFAAVLDEMVQF